jgi:hypothetical protein
MERVSCLVERVEQMESLGFLALQTLLHHDAQLPLMT